MAKAKPIRYDNKKTHLTAREKQVLAAMLEQNIMKGGTTRMQFEITKISDCEYEAKEWEYYAKASREFDLRPESKEVKWHYQRKFKFTSC